MFMGKRAQNQGAEQSSTKNTGTLRGAPVSSSLYVGSSLRIQSLIFDTLQGKCVVSKVSLRESSKRFSSHFSGLLYCDVSGLAALFLQSMWFSLKPKGCLSHQRLKTQQ